MLERLIAAIESIAESLKALVAAASNAGHPTAADAPPAASTAKPSTSKPSTSKPSKETTQAAPATKPAADAKPAATDAPFNYDLLKAAVIELANHSPDGKAKAVAILAKHGVKKASDAPAEKWPGMHAEVTAALQELAAPAPAGEEEFA